MLISCPGCGKRVYRRGLALGQLGRLDEAIQSFEKALALDPRSPLPRFNLAELLDRSRPGEDTGRAYQRFLGVATPAILGAEVQRARARLADLRGSGR